MEPYGAAEHWAGFTAMSKLEGIGGSLADAFLYNVAGIAQHCFWTARVLPWTLVWRSLDGGTQRGRSCAPTSYRSVASHSALVCLM